MGQWYMMTLVGRDQPGIVARLTRALFDARKRNTVPPFLFVVEEAHNFCPERGIGAALGALLANLIWTQIEGDPHPFVVVLFSVAGALLATWLQRYVIILGTAFGGAWTIIVGALAMMGDKTAMTAAAAGTRCPIRARSSPGSASRACAARTRSCATTPQAARSPRGCGGCCAGSGTTRRTSSTAACRCGSRKASR